MNSWEVRNEVLKEWAKFAKKNPDTMDEVEEVLGEILDHLDSGRNVQHVEQLVKELKHEKDGVYRVSQKSRRVTAARAYVYFKLDSKKDW